MASARFAGVPSPRTKPSFRTERFGLWEANTRATNGVLNSPVLNGLDASGNPTRHFSTNGNAYWNLALTLADQAAMSWDKEDYFGLKCYIRPRSVAGRIQVWRRGASGRGGPFLDIVDGKARFGWWDNDQKQEVYVETSQQVFWPGRVHYVFLKKRWPQINSTGGNWEDSYYSNNQIRRVTCSASIVGADGVSITDGTRIGTIIRRISSTVVDVYTTTNDVAWAGNLTTAGNPPITGAVVPSSDMLIVKRFGLSTDAAGIAGKTSYDALINTPVAAATINCVSFTSSDAVRSSGVSAVGVVSPVGATFWGAVNGVVNTADMDAGGGAEFYLPRQEMVGMYFTWGASAPVSLRGKTYRISGVSPGASGAVTSSFTCVDPYNLTTLPDFSSIVVGSPIQGQISTGIELVKSDGYDASRSPDNSGTSIYFMGSPDQGKATSTYQPFDGEVWCPGWMVDAPASAGVDARVFEDISAVTSDPMLVGVDVFEENVWTDGTLAMVHQLQYTTGYVRFAWDGRLYNATWNSPDIVASTQPAAIPLDSIDTTGPTITVNALSPPPTGLSRPFWEYVQPRGVWAGERYVAVGFHDPVQGISGRPSPVARVKAIEDDTTNPSGVVRIVVTDLPVGPPGVIVVVYESTADGNAATLFEAARVPNGTSEVAIDALESLLTLNQAADFAAWEPPRCSLVSAANSRMAYGALEVQPDAIVPSRVGQPGLADFDKLFRLAGGSGDRITAMAELDGLFAVFKRRAMGSVQFTVEGFAIVQLVSSGVGCVSPQALQAKDDFLWFVSDRGFQVSRRDGITNLGKPTYVGERVERFFSNVVDLRRLPRCSAAINRTRNQFVVALRVLGSTRTNARLSCDQSGEDIAYSRYHGPNVSALATVQSREAGADLIVGGTEEGFMVWLDRADTGLLMMGPGAKVWGALQVQSYGGAYSTDVALDVRTAQTLDTDLAGPMGVTARFNDAGGVEREVALLGADSTYLHYAEQVLEPIPDDRQVMMGAALLSWETPWIDMGNPERRKVALYLDLVLDTQDAQPTGKVYCAVYADWDRDLIRYTEIIDLGEVPYRLDLSQVEGRWLKLLVQHAPDTSDVRFDLAALVWRVSDADQV